MDASTRSAMLKIGGGMVSMGKSFSPESVGLDLRALDTGSGDKGDSGGGDAPKPKTEIKNTQTDNKSLSFREGLKAMESLGPQGLSNPNMAQMDWAAKLSPKQQQEMFPPN